MNILIGIILPVTVMFVAAMGIYFFLEYVFKGVE